MEVTHYSEDLLKKIRIKNHEKKAFKNEDKWLFKIEKKK